MAIARKKFLLEEKNFSKLRDELNLQRRKLPWDESRKRSIVSTGRGARCRLRICSAARASCIIYHFMFGPGWQHGCEHCSFWADHFDSVNIHIGERDTALAVVSRAPWTEIEPFKKRMGWKFRWVSSFKSDFNFDFHVSFTPEQIKSGVLPYNHGKDKTQSDEKGRRERLLSRY